MKTIAGFFLVLLIVVPMMALSGVAVQQLWAWFLVPLGLPKLTLAHAMGVSITTHLLASSSSRCKEEKPALEQIGESLMKPAIALLIGWIIHLAWMPR